MDRAGIFRATILETALGETKSGLGQVLIKILIDAVYENGAFLEFEGGATVEEIGYFILERHDGSLAEKTLQSFRDALGWQNELVDFAKENNVFKNRKVQAVFKYDNSVGYEGFKWAFINHIDSKPGLKPLDTAAQSSLIGRLGGKVRACMGGTQMAAPRPAVARPTAPQPRNGNGQTAATAAATATATAPQPRTAGPAPATRQAAPPQPRPTAPAPRTAPVPQFQTTATAVAEPVTRDDAWNRFCETLMQIEGVADRDNLNEFLQGQFLTILQDHRATNWDNMSPEDCAWMAEHGAEAFVPF